MKLIKGEFKDREKLEVLEPLHVREEMKNTIESLCKIYK